MLAPKCIQAAVVGIGEEGWPRNEAIVSMTDYSSGHQTIKAMKAMTGGGGKWYV